MESIYLVCAVLGGTVLACQLVMALLGLGGGPGDVEAGGDAAASVDHPGGDGGHHADPTAVQDSAMAWFLRALTLQTLTAAVTFFGLVGLGGKYSGWSEAGTLIAAFAAAFAAMSGIFYLMRLMQKLNADGTIRIERAIGKTGTVYLGVPGHKSGAGKVNLTVQNRSVEFPAITAGEELPTGSKVLVVGVVGSDTVEVVTAPSQAGSMTHG